MTIRPSNESVHLCSVKMVPPGMASVHKAQTSDHFSPLTPNGGWGGDRGGTWS